MKCVNIQKSGIGDSINQHNFFFIFGGYVAESQYGSSQCPSRIINCIITMFVLSIFVLKKELTFYQIIYNFISINKI